MFMGSKAFWVKRIYVPYIAFYPQINVKGGPPDQRSHRMLVFFQAAHSSTSSLTGCTQGGRGLETLRVCTMVGASLPSEQFLL